MKGAVFISLNEMIEQTQGIEFWEELLNEVNPESGGIYTSTQNYSEQEAIDYIQAISKKLDTPAEDIQRAFGKYLFGSLNKMCPMFTKSTTDFFMFLNSIHSVIHKEVRKLYTQPGLPEIYCVKHNDQLMTMTYSSPRKMCFLAEGLIQGAAEHYKNNIDINHRECMHKGCDHCSLDISVNNKTMEG